MNYLTRPSAMDMQAHGFPAAASNAVTENWHYICYAEDLTCGNGMKIKRAEVLLYSKGRVQYLEVRFGPRKKREALLFFGSSVVQLDTSGRALLVPKAVSIVQLKEETWSRNNEVSYIYGRHGILASSFANKGLSIKDLCLEWTFKAAAIHGLYHLKILSYEIGGCTVTLLRQYQFTHPPIVGLLEFYQPSEDLVTFPGSERALYFHIVIPTAIDRLLGSKQKAAFSDWALGLR